MYSWTFQLEDMRRNLPFIRSPVKPTAQLTRLKMGELGLFFRSWRCTIWAWNRLCNAPQNGTPASVCCTQQAAGGSPGSQMYVTHISGLKAFEMKSKMLHLFYLDFFESIIYRKMVKQMHYFSASYHLNGLLVCDTFSLLSLNLSLWLAFFPFCCQIFICLKNKHCISSFSVLNKVSLMALDHVRL